MAIARIAATTMFILGLASIAYAQETMNGKIASVDEATGKIGIIVASVSAEGPPTPTLFKVQNGVIFNSLQAGDQVSFTAENVSGVLTIEKITQE
jgi:Cu/Ag efflux protein CusF